MKKNLNLDRFISRMKSINVQLECDLNYPWVYIHKINGVRVKEKSMSIHGFTLGLMSSKEGFTFIDFETTFNLIRKYRGKL